MDTTHGTRRVRSIAILAATVAGFSRPGEGGTPPPQAERRLRVATYNLYLGADLQPLFGKSGPDAGGGGRRGVDARAGHRLPGAGEGDRHPDRRGASAPGRAPGGVALADRTAHRPGSADHALPPAPSTSWLGAGTPYDMAAVNAHFSAFLPVSGTEGVRWTQRNAVIARTDSRTRRCKRNAARHVRRHAAPPDRRADDPVPAGMGDRRRPVPGEMDEVRDHPPRGVQRRAAEVPGTGTGRSSRRRCTTSCLRAYLNSHRDFAGDFGAS